VEELLSLRVRPGAPNREVERKTRRQLWGTRGRLRDLRSIEDTLEDLYGACDGEGTTSACPILDALERPAAQDGGSSERSEDPA
jgi:hypothetical protein